MRIEAATNHRAPAEGVPGADSNAVRPSVALDDRRRWSDLIVDDDLVEQIQFEN